MYTYQNSPSRVHSVFLSSCSFWFSCSSTALISVLFSYTDLLNIASFSMTFHDLCYFYDFSVFRRCWLGGKKGIQPVKNWVVGCWRGCLGWGADLHIAQQMPLPLIISCSSKSRLVLPFLVLPFWYLLTRVVPYRFQQSSKMVVWKMTFLNSMTFHDFLWPVVTLIVLHNFQADNGWKRSYQ